MIGRVASSSAMNSGFPLRRLGAACAALLLVIGACGSDDDTAADDADTTTTAAPDESPETTATDETSTTTEPEATDAIDRSTALFMAPPEAGAELTIAESGITSATTTVSVLSADESADGIAVSTSEVVVGEAGSVTVERSYTTGADGSLSISAAGFFASGTGFEVTATGDDIRITSITELESGEASTGNTFVELNASGIDARNDVAYTIVGGGTESVTTPLGTFDAQIVDIELSIDSSIGGAQTGTVRYAFLPGFGVLTTDVAIAGFAINSTVTSSTVTP